MIEITHKQAQRLIRQGLDRAAPEEQWNALQAHLERCAGCSAYRARRQELERALRRDLERRWAGTEGLRDPRGLARAILERRYARERRLRGVGYAGLALLAAVLVFWFVQARRAPERVAQKPQAVLPTATPAPTLTPTSPVVGSGFQGLVALEAAAEQAGDGSPGGGPPNGEIFLLEAGPSGSRLTNLTGHPAEDSAPAWSPDGQWIAFLSDRERADGLADIYVISIAGTRLTRLTADPHLAWSGPLAWSPDGRWIAARADDGRNGFLYRVSLDGAPPRPLSGSRGARMPRFAPEEPLLAYLVEEGSLAYLRIYNTRTNETFNVNRAEAAQNGRAGPGALSLSAFDWSPDGSSILYITHRAEPERDPYAVEVREARLRGTPSQAALGGSPGLASQGLAVSRVLMSVPSLSPVLSVALTPQGDLLYTRTYRRDGRWAACTPLVAGERPSSAVGRDGPQSRSVGALALPGLCIDSHLERDAWGDDGQMLVAAARSTTEDDPGIYAFLFPQAGGDLANTRVVRSVRLADLPAGAGALRPRPSATAGNSLTPIDPRPARAPVGADLPPARPPASILGNALVVVQERASFGIARLDAGGQARVMENGWGGYCARISPSGESVVFAATGGEAGPGGSEIYSMRLDGSQRENLTRLGDLYDLFNPALQRKLTGQYGCPVWSPDGRLVAAWVTVNGSPYLTVTEAVVTEAVDTEAMVTEAVVTEAVGTEAVGTDAVGTDAVGTDADGPPGSGSPDEQAPPADPPNTRSRFFELDPAGYRAAPVWLPDSRRVLVFLDPPGQEKTLLAVVDTRTGAVSPLAASDGWDAASAAALSPDGALLAYTTAQFGPGNELSAGLNFTQLEGEQTQPAVTLPGYADRYGWGGYSALGWLAASAGLPGSGDGRADLRLGLALRGSPNGRLPSLLLLYDPVTYHLETLLSLDEALASAAWSPDGEWVLYSTRSGLWALSIRGALEGYAAPVWISDVVAYEMELEGP